MEHQTKELLGKLGDLHCLTKRSLLKRNDNEKWVWGFRLIRKSNFFNADKLIAKRICRDVQGWILNHDTYIQSYFNKVKLFQYPELCKSFKQIATSEFQEALFQLILLSRDIQGIEIASSNAISILNSSGFQFFNRDMHGIKVTYADLSASYFYNSNLEGSDLSHANISFSNLEYTSFKGCDMRNTSHGWILIGEMKKCEEAWLSPSGKYFISDSNSCYGKFFNLWTLNENGMDKTQNPQEITGKPIQFSPSENYFIFLLNDSFYAIHDIAENVNLPEKFPSPKEFSISQSDTYLAYFSSDNALWIKNLKTEITSLVMNFDAKPIFIKWSPSEEFLLIGKSNRESILWDWRNCKETWHYYFDFNLKNDPLDHIFSCNGKFIGIYQLRNPRSMFWIWNTKKNALKSFSFKEKGEFCLQFSPVFENILIKCGRPSSLWNAEVSELLTNFNGFYSLEPAFVFSPCGNYIFLLCKHRGALGIYDCKKNDTVRFINCYLGLTNYRISVKCPQLAIKIFSSECVVIADSNLIKNLYDFLDKNRNLVSIASFSFDDKYFATCYKLEIKIWDMRSKSIVSIINTNEEIASIQFSPCSDVLVTKSNPSDPLTATIWNWKKNKMIWRDKFITPIRVISFSISGNFYAIGSGEYVYIFKNRHKIHLIESEWEKRKIYILCGSFTCCENYFIYGNDKGYINFFSLISQNIEKKIFIGTSRIHLLSISAFAEYIAVLDKNGKLTIWNFITEPTIIYETDFSLNSKLQSIILSPRGNYIILQIRDAHSFEIFDFNKGQVIYKSSSCLRSIESISWSPSGNFISAAYLGFFGIWDFSILTEKNQTNVECLSWASSLRHFNIKWCDFSNAIMDDKNIILFKEFHKQMNPH
ncbi:unnamed protein product [Blepharisma stoltei]|uniref:Uncharacterized protein n=1 Tax=Blepharisma stoltei TaxID=1481888 RepID=A0AAU9KH02_9CILI|nr:unnamed protein product [Blepharisma stoltei]